MAPLVFADRFIVLRTGEAIDLATGDWVWLRSVTPAGPQERDGWLRRCAALTSFWHPNLVPLLDYGAVGRAAYFEAWACSATRSGWTARDGATADAVSGAVSFLMSRSLAPGRLKWQSIIDLSGRPALLATDETGLPLDSGREADLERCASDLERLLSACPKPSSGRGGATAAAPHDGGGPQHQKRQPFLRRA